MVSLLRRCILKKYFVCLGLVALIANFSSSFAGSESEECEQDLAEMRIQSGAQADENIKPALSTTLCSLYTLFQNIVPETETGTLNLTWQAIETHCAANKEDAAEIARCIRNLSDEDIGWFPIGVSGWATRVKLEGEHVKARGMTETQYKTALRYIQRADEFKVAERLCFGFDTTMRLEEMVGAIRLAKKLRVQSFLQRYEEVVQELSGIDRDPLTLDGGRVAAQSNQVAEERRMSDQPESAVDSSANFEVLALLENGAKDT